MVGPLTLMKVLHCRSLKVKVLNSPKTVSSKKKLNTIRREATSRDNFCTSSVKQDIKVEFTDDMCRVCLQDGKIPIFGDTTENIADCLLTIAGIEVSVDDSYPKKICKPCHTLLEGAMLLRRNAQLTDLQLRKDTNVPVSTNYEDFRNISSDTEESNNLSIQNVNISKNGLSVDDYDDDSLILSVHDVKKDVFSVDDHKTFSNNPVIQEVNSANVKDHFSNLRCIKCDLQFESFEEYSEHKLSEEHENKKESCPICNKLFNSSYIKRHIAIHNQDASFICDICGKHFTLRSTFTRHRMAHSTDLPFKCSLCPYRGRYSQSLKMHMRFHTGERPYQCAECKAKFINKSNLIKHRRKHVQHYDFNCEMCGKSYFTKRELDEHIRVCHRGIKEHLCRICHKSFGYRKQMMKHELKVHKREKLRAGRMPLYLKLQKQPESNEESIEAT